MALFVSPGEQPPVQPAILAGIVKSLPLRSGVLRASGERLNVGPAGENPLAVLLEWRSATGPNAQHHRVETSQKLAEDAGVQGIAIVSRLDSDQSHYSIELFAAGSAQPDVFTWADDLDMSRSVLQALDSRDSLFDYRLEGALLVDVLNSDHPVLVVLEAQEHPSTGARVLSVDEVEFTSARDVLSHLALTNAVEVRLELQDTSGATTTAAWPVTRRPRLLWLEDSTRHFNRLALEYQFLAVTAESPMEQSVARLNQAIAYMAVRNWEAARVLLDSLDEGDAHPWPEGTIALLRGKCLEGLHRLPEARQEWQVASKASGQLTDEGPDIAAQAKVWLALLDGM